MRCFYVSLLLLMLGSDTAIGAQVNTAALGGQVQDDSKAVLPGVTVTATENATGREFVSVSDVHGEYRIINLAPGVYTIQASLVGFSTFRVERLELLVGQNVNLPVVLGVAALEESVTVTGEAPIVNVTSSQVTGNVDRRQMAELPLQGRNWLELSMLVKGVTANAATNLPGVSRDEMFQLHLDGQSVSQRIGSSSAFGQPKFSREAIAEFQIVTNMFDVTQGRSTGVQVQAVTRSGTNAVSGAAFGYFRDDKFNAADKIANSVLPFSNQQTGGVLGGPIVRDRMHFFFSYEYERQPGTIISQPVQLPLQKFAFPTKRTDHSYLGRLDYQIDRQNFLNVRWSRWGAANPFSQVGSTTHPSQVSSDTQGSDNVIGTWSWVMGNNKVSEFRLGYSGYDWAYRVPTELDPYPELVFPGLTIGPRYNYNQEFNQANIQARYDLGWHRGAHDFKIGGEFIRVHDTGQWFIIRRGQFFFHTRPPDLDRRFPASAWNDPSQWDLTGLDPYVQRYDVNMHKQNWLIDIPRPTFAAWIGDTWRLNNRLTLNLGVRWDDDLGATAPPGIVETDIVIDNGLEVIDAGQRQGIRDHNNIAPRVGFAYSVDDKNDLVIRGGTGAFYSVPVSNVTFSQQIYNPNQMLASSFPYDGLPGFVQDPLRGLTEDDLLSGRVPLPPQVPRVLDPQFKMPYTWQSTVGFQKQIGAVTGLEVDLAHWVMYNDVRTRSLNLKYDPATGYNVNPLLGRANPEYGDLIWFASTGTRDNMALQSALTRRYSRNFQAGLTYTFMFFANDDGSIGYTGGGANNQFDYLNGEWARSTDFQRHTMRVNGLYQLPAGFSLSALYFYGSGNPSATSLATAPYGKPGTNRLNIGAPIRVAASGLDRFTGPDVIGTGTVIPRNGLDGLSLHKIDLRLTKNLTFGPKVKVALTAEVFNLLNRANYTAFVNQVDSATFGQPRTAQVPRSGQLGFRLSF